MKLINTNELIVKKSKFICFLYSIESIDEISDILDNIKKEHKKANHFPYAYKYSNIEKKSDDKEPSGTCGTPLLKVLQRNNLNNHIIIVVRYFGGTKLGVGLLLRSYNTVANRVIK